MHYYINEMKMELLVRDRETQQVIGTYRVLTQSTQVKPKRL